MRAACTAAPFNSAGVLVAAEDSGEEPYCVAGMLVYFYQPFTYDLKPWMVIKELFVAAKCRGGVLVKHCLTQPRRTV